MKRQNKLDDGLNRLFSSSKRDPSEENSDQPEPAKAESEKPASQSKKSEKPEPKAPPKSHLIPVPSKPTLPLQMPFSDDPSESDISETSDEETQQPPVEEKVKEVKEKAEKPKNRQEKEIKEPSTIVMEETKKTERSVSESLSVEKQVAAQKELTKKEDVNISGNIEEYKDTSDDEQIVVFTLAEQYYGVNISVVESIIKMQPITVVPRAPHYIEGVTNLRGTVVPVVSLHKRLNIPVVDQTTNSRIIVINSHGISAGLIVDEVNSVTFVSGKDIEKVSHTISSVDSSYIRSIAKTNGKLIIMLELENVLKHRT